MVSKMEFIHYLTNRQQYSKEANIKRNMKLISARQYNSRLTSMIDKGIYNEEDEVTDCIVRMIKETYVDHTNEYERTLKYYIEYKQYFNKR
jgi:hypothetical protein